MNKDDRANNNIQKEIDLLEKDIKHLKNIVEVMEQKITKLKELVWERESKKESSKMFKVLENEKPSTIVRSNVGNVIVDKEFMDKEISKHLDDTALRGMVTTEEMLSFPRVARNVEAKYNEEINDYTWKVRANDESILAYGSREYVKENKEINRLLTAHSKTDVGERKQSQADRVSSATYFNDPDFRGSATESITQKQAELQRRLDINLNNHRRVSDEKQKQEYLVRANAIKEQAKKQHIALDSKSLKALEKANLTKSNTNTKER
ncbi:MULTISPECIES: helicase [Helicobacter]|uniref:helicase n=2 Tax=Helicobacteraceae TaxID=72293 RepID=UPI000A966417|nr:helicase [Helicobacter sp. MIT 03-1616]